MLVVIVPGGMGCQGVGTGIVMQRTSTRYGSNEAGDNSGWDVACCVQQRSEEKNERRQ